MTSAVDSTQFSGMSACPTCHRPLTPPLDVHLSGMLDFVVLAIDVLRDCKAALESRVRP